MSSTGGATCTPWTSDITPRFQDHGHPAIHGEPEQASEPGNLSTIALSSLHTLLTSLPYLALPSTLCRVDFARSRVLDTTFAREDKIVSHTLGNHVNDFRWQRPLFCHHAEMELVARALHTCQSWLRCLCVWGCFISEHSPMLLELCCLSMNGRDAAGGITCPREGKDGETGSSKRSFSALDCLKFLHQTKSIINIPAMDESPVAKGAV